MNSWSIKGTCENCGFAYKGSIGSDKTVFPVIHCPACHEATYNFDEETTVDRNDIVEAHMVDHKETVFDVVNSKIDQLVSP